MLVRTFISGLVGVGILISASYGINSAQCNFNSPSQDSKCWIRTFNQSLDGWKLGFIIGGVFGLISGIDYRRLALRMQPIHLSLISVSCLGIYCLLGSKTVGLSGVNLQQFEINNSNYSPRMQAFLATIGWAETGTSAKESYRKLVFNGSFNNFSTHPLIKQCAPINGKRICSTAAGAYQMLDKSWWDVQPKLKLPDFSPQSQDRMAVEYIRRNNAIADVESGNFTKAACKVGKIWASFPCNSYNQNPKTMEELNSYYRQQLLALGGG